LTSTSQRSGAEDQSDRDRPASSAHSSTGAAGDGKPVLEVEDLHVWYGEAIHAVRGVSLSVGTGRLVALLGANGAGKTTLLRSITGLLPFHGGTVRGGEVRVDGQAVSRLAPASIVRRGVSQVMEGRRVFPDLTVAENLRAGGFTRRSKKELADTHTRIMDMFPSLAARENTAAGYLSGGEQQMLAIGRALMQSPRLLLLDEPSLGLAPIIVQQVFDMIKELNRQGTSIVVIEQNVGLALQSADYAYVLERGRLVSEGRARDLLNDDAVRAAYLGVSEQSSAPSDSMGQVS
jgi:branched-chain amino acid transport system ATP-binding protein